MRSVDVISAVAERLLATVYSAIKIAGPAKFKVSDSVRMSKYKTVFEKGYTPNWTTEVFKIVKIQHINPVTYLLEDYHEKTIVRAFYKYELHRATHPDIPCGKSIAQEGKRDLRKVVGIRWIAQFMNTQGQCVVKIKFIINLLYTFFIQK